VGVFVAASRINNEAKMTDLIKREFNSATPGNHMKWDATEPSNDNFNFANGVVAAFTTANAM